MTIKELNFVFNKEKNTLISAVLAIESVKVETRNLPHEPTVWKALHWNKLLDLSNDRLIAY